jgi:starvation-inducible DNA-binding protein
VPNCGDAGIRISPAADGYVRALIEANKKLIQDAARARDLAGELNDAETQDLMVGRITLHQKTAWMLNSYLKS